MRVGQLAQDICPERDWALAMSEIGDAAAAGCTMDDVIDVTSFHTDPGTQFPAIMATKQEAFPEAPYPSWTALGVTWLAGFDVEIKVVARIPETVGRA